MQRLPASEEQQGGHTGNDEQVQVLGKVEESEVHAGVFGMITGCELALGFGKVERATVCLGGTGNHIDSWNDGVQIIDFNIGIFFLIAVSSIGVLGILLAGWSSNNKFTLIGSLIREPAAGRCADGDMST